MHDAIKHVFWIVLLVVLAWASHQYHLADSIAGVQDGLRSVGIAGPLVFIALMALAIIIVPVPSAPLTLSAGILYGPALGTFYSLIGAQIGAVTAFLIARGIGKDWIYRVFKRDLVFCQQCTVRYLTWLVLALRLIPFTQFDIVSYGAGLTAIPLGRYALATFIGMIPATFAEVLVGASFGFSSAGMLLSIAVMALIIAAPVIIKRTDAFGLKKYIYHAPHLTKRG